MERLTRTAYQGTINIIRFNWHFYALGAVLIIVLFASAYVLPVMFSPYAMIFAGLVVLGTGLSLGVSCYVYDISDLYKLTWLAFLPISSGHKLVNVNAGFDETSVIISERYPACGLTVFDFYDASRHTEVSIERARKAYAAFPGTIRIETSTLPLEPLSTDFAFAIMAAHEIRSLDERICFFAALSRSLTDTGRIVVVEHLRDIPNFFAYNFGFFHFLSGKEWNTTFTAAGLVVEREQKVTPFVSAFILKKDGTTH